eukprot:s1605_g14.t1
MINEFPMTHLTKTTSSNGIGPGAMHGICADHRSMQLRDGMAWSRSDGFSDTPEGSTCSFERLEIHSSFSGSGRPVRREFFEVHHKTRGSRATGCYPESLESASASANSMTSGSGLDMSIPRLRDIPWLDRDGDDTQDEMVGRCLLLFARA